MSVNTIDLNEHPAAESTPLGALDAGSEIIRQVVKTLPPSPGVYRMIDRKGDVLYVGKARSLRNRVSNYTNPAALSNRIRRMIAETASMEIVTTHTEVEALLLECNLIKKLTPRYNVLLRDDKSFPHIHLRSDHPVPQLTKHRGARNESGDYFGPFASAGAVNRTITALHRAFLLRSCSDSVFTSRTRPCLQFQIKRCSAPCVDRISSQDYANLVNQARGFLTGHSQEIKETLAHEMMAASDCLDFEAAAEIRNRIRALAQVQAHQDINVDGVSDADVIAAYEEGGHTCIQVFFFRGGQNWGNRPYFPSHERGMPIEDVLAAFIGQFYDNKLPPQLLLLSREPSECELLAEALCTRAGRKIALNVPQRGGKRKLVENALTNAREALARKLVETTTQGKLMAGLAATLGLDAPPRSIEVYDNSHIQGTNAIGAMIVAGPEGFEKNRYRKFNIRGVVEKKPALNPGLSEDGAAAYNAEPSLEAGAVQMITPGDDFAMMREVLERRFRRALKEEEDGVDTAWPDLILLDGGAGQLSIAQSLFAEMGIDDVAVAAIAKGPDRNAGRERIFMPGKPPLSLDHKDPVLYFLQRLRDEAHRFAIGTHRARRQKAIGQSLLDEVTGIGPGRKKALLHHFGSARAVARAGLEDLACVSGISHSVAKKIYDHFHGNE